MLKAYYVYEKGFIEDGCDFVAAKNANIAKSYYDCDYIDARAKRVKDFDKLIDVNMDAEKIYSLFPGDVDLCNNNFFVNCSKCGCQTWGEHCVIKDKIICEDCQSEGLTPN